MAFQPAPPGPADLARLVRVSLGQEAADGLIRDARVVGVFDHSVSEPTCVALACGRVAALGQEAEAWAGPHTEICQAGGRYLIPGLIDAHTHLDSLFGLEAFAAHALASGNTTAVSEMAMVAGAWGIDGCRAFMDAAQASPQRVLLTAPPLVPPFPAWETSAGLDRDGFNELLNHPACLGVGETYWPAITDGEERAQANYAAALAAGKRIEGHAAGARGAKLMAYAAAGTSSCHESISPEDAAQRLSLGLAVQVREGFVRREMEAVVPALKDLPESGQVMLVTDLADFDDLMSWGAMNPLLAKAVALGVAPARAVAWCSLNPARYFGLDRLGAVAPGWVADLVLVEDLIEFRASRVWLEGRAVARDGKLLGEHPPYVYPPEARATMRCPALTPEAFALPANGESALVRVVEASNPTITREGEAVVPVEAGNARPDPAQDVLKIAHINRHSRELELAVGFARGWGLKDGALASTVIWDTTNIFVAGASEQDMAVAAEAVRAMGGGWAVARGGRVLASLPLPIAGVISPEPLPGILASAEACRAALAELGCPLPRPFLTAQTFCFTGLPFLRLTNKGLVDIRARKFVEVVK
ncbi:MAG: amidohydrolase family protein [Desulfarculaceae bacterium]|nr:amidohydrolase family protein [Desulfarculaceae bacterium]MCF8072741.1 amidohydrolase family protein [Desulfarculaceae bacterium]MCF8103025.1 amidohydrolase family protein [Desulfarculaceae bacterium]MCF8118110.1 amidohydrolase family protein [Desulfarculaceae bacterium]